MVLRDSTVSLLTLNCCLPGDFMFTSHYETYLDAKFPFGSYKQVFLAPEMAVSSSTFGAAMGIFSSQILYDEKVIDQVRSYLTQKSYLWPRKTFRLAV